MNQEIGEIDCLIRELSKRGVEEFHFKDRSNGHGFVAFWVPGHPFKKDEDFEADVDGLRLAHMAWKLTRGSDYTHFKHFGRCLLYTSPSPRDRTRSRMPSSA